MFPASSWQSCLRHVVCPASSGSVIPLVRLAVCALSCVATVVLFLQWRSLPARDSPPPATPTLLPQASEAPVMRTPLNQHGGTPS